MNFFGRAITLRENAERSVDVRPVRRVTRNSPPSPAAAARLAGDGTAFLAPAQFSLLFCRPVELLKSRNKVPGGWTVVQRGTEQGELRQREEAA